MSEKSENIRAILLLNGGEIVGRTRLQKTLYFMESVGAGFGFEFEYYHYGPYSDEASTAIDDAKALGLIDEQWKTGAHLRPYAIFRTDTSRPLMPDYNTEGAEKQKDLLNVLAKYDAISLELAATADFLEKSGFNDAAWNETATRKSTKASPERIAKARAMLDEIRSL